MRLIWLRVFALLAFALPAEAGTGARREPAWRSADPHPYPAAIGRVAIAPEGLATGHGDDLRLETLRPSHPRLRPPRNGRTRHPPTLPSGAEPLPYDATAPSAAA